MKKLLALVMMLAAFCCSWSGGLSKTEASNWVRFFTARDGAKDMYMYIDTDSFVYTDYRKIAQCWFKFENSTNDNYFIAHNYFNLGDRTMAMKSYIERVDGKDVPQQNAPYLDYQSVVPDTMNEYLFNLVKYIALLDDRGIQWEFNKEYIPEPSALDSDAWQMNKSGKSKFDSKTATTDGGIRRKWNKYPTGYMLYWKIDDANNKSARLAVAFYENNEIVKEHIFPVIIFCDNNKDVSTAEEEAWHELVRCVTNS